MGRVKKKDLAYIGLTELTPQKVYPALYSVSQSPDPMWRELIGDFEPWRQELELAARSLDREKRRSGQQLYRYLTGEPIDQNKFRAAVYELNASLLFKVNWDLLEKGLASAQGGESR